MVIPKRIGMSGENDVFWVWFSEIITHCSSGSGGELNDFLT